MSAEASAKADLIVTASSFALWATEDKSAGVRNAKALRAGVSNGAVAQLGERLLCKQEVTGSIPVGSTSTLRFFRWNLPLSGIADSPYP